MPSKQYSISSGLKTIRFNNSTKCQVALEAINNFSDYGFSSANDMVMTALYELAKRHDNPLHTDLPLDEIAKKMAKVLKDELQISGFSDTIPPTTPSGPTSLTASSDANDDFSDIIEDILSL